MDVDGFWSEALRRWPSLVGKLESERDPERRFPWLDFTVPTTWFRYTDGPPLSEMRELVANFGGSSDWVRRRFSVGALLLEFERGHTTGRGLRQPPQSRFPTAPVDPDLSDANTISEIEQRNGWARASLPYELERGVNSDDALIAALGTQQYPFTRTLNTTVLAIEPLPMPVIGSHEQLSLGEHETPDTAETSLLLKRREDGHPILVNLTYDVLYIGSGENPQRLPTGPIPTAFTGTTRHGRLLVSAIQEGPLAQVNLDVDDPGKTEFWDIPPRQEGLIYIVDYEILEAFPDRNDFVRIGQVRRPPGWTSTHSEDACLDEDERDEWLLESVIGHAREGAAGS